MRFKKGDTVIVTIGKDKGKRGKIDKTYPREHAVLVAGVNMFKKHAKKRDEQHPGGILDFPRPLDTGKVALVCPSCGQPTRIGYLVVKGEKERICRKCERKI